MNASITSATTKRVTPNPRVLNSTINCVFRSFFNAGRLLAFFGHVEPDVRYFASSCLRIRVSFSRQRS